jgi:hypothetical protein
MSLKKGYQQLGDHQGELTFVMYMEEALAATHTAMNRQGYNESRGTREINPKRKYLLHVWKYLKSI